MRHTWHHRAAALVVLVATAGLVGAPAVAAPPLSPHALVPASPAAPPEEPAAEAERVGFGVVPATAQDLDYRAYLVYGLTPGSVAYDHIGIVNYGTDPLVLEVYASDAEAPVDGGFALAAASSPAVDLGAWIGIEGAGSVEVPGRDDDGQPGKVILPVSITVPADAEPGDHAAGIVASLDTLGQNPEGQNVELQQRVASRVYVQVGGQITPELSITGVQTDFVAPTRPWRSGSMDVTYTVANTGNVRLGFDPTARVAGPFGLLARSQDSDVVMELLPGASTEVDVTVADVWPVVRAGVRMIANPVAAPAAADPGLTPVRAERTVWAITWEIAAAVVVLVLLLALPVVRAVRRRRPGPARLGGGPPADARQPQPVP